MSTIIEARRLLGWALVALSAWTSILVALPFLGPPGRQVAVLGESGAAVRAIAAAGGRIVEVRSGAVLALSADPDFAERLYRAGAPLLLEGRIAAGCFRPGA